MLYFSPLRIYSINFVSHYKSAVVIPFLLMTDLWVFIWYKQTISISLEQDSSWNYLFFTLPTCNKEKIHCKFLTIHQIIHKAADLWLYTARQCILDIWLMTVQHELSEPYSPTWLLWLPTISLNRDTKFDYCVPIKKRQFFSKPLPKLGNTCIWLNLQGLNLLTVKYEMISPWITTPIWKIFIMIKLHKVVNAKKGAIKS